MKRFLACLLVVIALAGSLAAMPAAAAQPRWVSAWSTSPVDASLSEIGALSGVSVPTVDVSNRVVVRPTLSGDQVRLVFSNEYSRFPLVISACSAGRSVRGDAAVSPCSMQTVRSYASVGNRTHSPSMLGALPLNLTADSGAYDVIPCLCEIDVRSADPGAGACVVFGDSTVANEIPRMLASRLRENGLQNVSVTQAAIKGDRLCFDGVGKLASITGRAGVDRFAADVLDQAGVTSVIVKIGINDIIHPQLKSKQGTAPYASFKRLTADFAALVEMAHARGVKVYFAELTPWKGYTRNLFGITGEDIRWTTEADALRVQLNDWFRSDACPADGVVLFPSLSDPGDPAALAPAYTTDGVHFTDAGAQLVADTIPLEWFR